MPRPLPLASIAILALTALTYAAQPAAPVAAPAVKLAAVTDRPDAIYAASDKVTFTITLKDNAGKPIADAEIDYTLDKDGVPPAKTGKLKLSADGSATLPGQLDEPGFLRLHLTFKGPQTQGKPVTALAGAAIDPLKIKPSLPVPEDFDAYWASKKTELAKVELKPVLTPVKTPVPNIEAFDAQIPCAGPAPVSGYYARPAAAAPKSCPAILLVHGAGVRSAALASAAGMAASYKAIAMDINAHGIPNGKPDQFYKDLADGPLKNYRTDNADDREKIHFIGMYLRLIRALEFLTAQPQWDGRVLIVKGSSQGGGQSIAAAGLDPRVTLICAGVPALCDHSGRAAGRINGWPRIVPTGPDGKPASEKALQAARYIDCMNLATRSKAQALLSVGFIDTTCPPTSVYATYNNLPGQKQIVNEPLMGHASSKAFEEQSKTLITQHIAKLKAPQP